MNTRPGSEKTNLRVEDRVRCERTEAARGSWSRYEGREGTVSAINRQKFPNGSTYVEIGVSFGYSARPGQGGGVGVVWFRDDELVKL